MNPVYLRSKNIVLRQFEADDIHHLRDLDSDPEVMQYLTGGIPSSEEYLKGAISRILALKEKFKGDLGFWVAESAVENEFVGWFHLLPSKDVPENAKRLEIGYRLKKKFWGRGFATEVSRALVAKAFNVFIAEIVFAQALKGNLASIRVMKKLGMTFQKEFKHEHHNNELCVEYSIQRKDFSEFNVS